MAGKYLLGEDSDYRLDNDTSKARNCEITYDGAKGFEIYDPLTGEIEYLNGSSITINLEQFCAKIVVVKK
jgi:hypothetical protein